MTSREPKVSIGLPVYNGERYLSEAVESILNQTFDDFELVISDNASTDRTAEICQSYAADRRVRYYRNERNLGAAPNFNRTFELSRGTYFKWAAHDDVLAPTYLERCVGALDADHAAVLCQTAVSQIDEQGRLVGPARFLLVGTDDFSPSQRFAKAIKKDHSCLHIFGLIRSEILRRTPLLMACLNSDRVLLAELSLHGRFVEVPEHLFRNRDHAERYVNSALRDPVARVAWYDPNREGRWAGQYMTAYRKYFGAVWRSAPTISTKVACYGHLLRWPTVDKSFFPLLTDREYDTLDPRLRAKIRKVKRLLLWWRGTAQPPAQEAPHT